MRGATSSVGLACLELARAAGLRMSRRRAARPRRRRCASAAPRASCSRATASPSAPAAALPEGGADGVVDLIGARAVLESLAFVRRGGTVCNSGLLGGEWVIDDFEPIENIPSGRKLTAYHSDEAADASVGGPLLRAVVEQVERGEVDPASTRSTRWSEIADAHRRMAAGAATGKLVVRHPPAPGLTPRPCRRPAA